MSGSSRLRIVAVLLPAALLLHEGAYGFGGAGGQSHGYLALAAPALVAAAVSFALASLLAATLRPGAELRQSPGAAALMPVVFAAALLAVFAAQELAEGLVAGVGAGQLLDAALGAPLLLPLALLLGLIAAATVDLLGWAGARIARLALRGRPRRRRERPRTAPVAPPSHKVSPLAFGLARRPPPAPAVGAPTPAL